MKNKKLFPIQTEKIFFKINCIQIDQATHISNQYEWVEKSFKITFFDIFHTKKGPKIQVIKKIVTYGRKTGGDVFAQLAPNFTYYRNFPSTFEYFILSYNVIYSEENVLVEKN